MSWNCVAYMDETHNSERYWICGVVVDAREIIAAKERLAGVAEKAAASFDLDEPPELHGYDLWHREGPFEDVPPRACGAIYGWALDALVEARPRIILRGVVRRSLYFNAHRIAWRYAIESVDELDCEAPILVVADEHKETEEALRGDIRAYMADGTGGWKPRVIERVLPDLKFLDSRTNTLLQAADLVAYLNQRRVAVPVEPDTRAQATREWLWEKIEGSVAVCRLWEPH